MSVPAVYRPPFSFTPEVRHVPAGLTLLEMSEQLRALPGDSGEGGHDLHQRSRS